MFQAVVSHYKVISLWEGCGFSGGCNIFSRVDEVGKGKGTSPRHMALDWPFRPLRRLSSTLLAGSRAICSVWQAQVFLPTRVSSKMAVPIVLFFVDHISKSPDFGNAARRKATWGLLVHQAVQRTHSYKRPFPVSMDDVIWRIRAYAFEMPWRCHGAPGMLLLQSASSRSGLGWVMSSRQVIDIQSIFPLPTRNGLQKIWEYLSAEIRFGSGTSPWNIAPLDSSYTCIGGHLARSYLEIDSGFQKRSLIRCL